MSGPVPALVGRDVRPGVVRWETQVALYEQGYSYASGPIVAEGQVIAGIGNFLTPEILNPDGTTRSASSGSGGL